MVQKRKLQNLETAARALLVSLETAQAGELSEEVLASAIALEDALDDLRSDPTVQEKEKPNG